MSEGLELLKKIGVQSIHEDTHVSRRHIEDVVDGRFEDISKVQFIGFISIFEREYGVDLESLKKAGLDYYSQSSLELNENTNGIFVTPKKEKKMTPLYIGLILFVLISVAYFNINANTNESQNFKESTEAEESPLEVLSEEEINDENISSLELNTTKPIELNATNEQNTTLEIEENVKNIVKNDADLKVFRILAKSRVWVGYIDIKNNKKYQETFKDTLTLNRQKEWIIILGHSNVKVEANGETLSFNAKGNLRLWYKNGVVKKIDFSKFKELNRGKKW